MAGFYGESQLLAHCRGQAATEEGLGCRRGRALDSLDSLGQLALLHALWPRASGHSLVCSGSSGSARLASLLQREGLLRSSYEHLIRSILIILS